MDRYDIEFLDVLKQRADKAEENLRSANPDTVDRLLAEFIDAKNEYVAFRSKFSR